MKKIAVLLLACAALLLACACVKVREETDYTAYYEINASFDIDEETLTCNQRVSYCNDTGDTIGELPFNLYPAAFREDAAIKPIAENSMKEAYYNGKSFGGITVTNVRYNNETALYAIKGDDKNILSVIIPDGLTNDERAEISMEYVVRLPKTNTRFGITETGANLCNFYPVLCVYENGSFREAPYYSCGDPFYSNCANYTVCLSYPSSGVMAATGEVAEKHTQNKITRAVYVAENVRDFAAAYLRDGRVASDRVGSTDVNYYYTDDKSPDFSLSAGTAAINVYESTFGAYPYPVFNIVDSDFIYGGMEYPCLVLINNELSGFWREYTVAHETAHQWWYGLVGSDSVNDAWQDEGLTEFSTALYFKKTGRGALFNYIVGNAFDSYVKVAAYLSSTGTFDGVMRRPSYEFSGEAAYVVTAYDKGLLLNNCLYGILGEGEYLKACRAYLAANKYSIASAEDYISAFPSCREIIVNWLYGKVIIGANYT